MARLEVRSGVHFECRKCGWEGETWGIWAFEAMDHQARFHRDPGSEDDPQECDAREASLKCWPMIKSRFLQGVPRGPRS